MASESTLLEEISTKYIPSFFKQDRHKRKNETGFFCLRDMLVAFSGQLNRWSTNTKELVYGLMLCFIFVLKGTSRFGFVSLQQMEAFLVKENQKFIIQHKLT